MRIFPRRLGVLVTASALTLSASACDLKNNLTTPQVPAKGQMLLIQHPETSPGTDMASRITHAKSRVWMEMYSLNDPDVVSALEGAKARGVDVHVMLNHGYGVATSTKKSYATLISAGVPVRWAPTGYIFHVKTTVIDDAAVISSANLNQNDYLTYRDYSIVDSNPSQVAAVAKTFTNDWALKDTPRHNTVAASGLVWSPDATASFTKLIASAKKSVIMSSEEFKNPVIATALASTASKGVSCTVLVPHESKDANITAGQKTQVTKAGCTFVDVPEPDAQANTGVYEHGKLVVVDGRTALMGSQNDSTTSLTKNRELSVTITDPDIVSALSSTIHGDAGH